MFEQFSRGYYLGRLYVEPHEVGAAMCRDQHERVNQQLYGDEGVTRTDLPLVMKLGRRHFPVRGDEEHAAGHAVHIGVVPNNAGGSVRPAPGHGTSWSPSSS